MSGPIFIEARSGLRGLGADMGPVYDPNGAGMTPGRTQVTEAQWNAQVTSQWNAANTGIIPQLRRQVGYLGMGGFGALAIAAVLGATGNTKLAISVGALGIAGVAVGTFSAAQAEKTASLLTVGSQPGVSGWRGW